ncbi:MAG: alpha-glucosidase C-terminal domain-containing protein [Actinobacteria bacterium]|nr:alpha-glucosidase C-terminal domain-containing protein [Actinomycetota bacterium]
MVNVDNPSVLAYVRQVDDDAVLCVNNLSRFAQPAELPLQQFAGRTPIELLGRVPFPKVGELPYFVTLGPYSFYWFQLVEQQ